MDRGACPATVHRVAKNWTGLNEHTPTKMEKSVDVLGGKGCKCGRAVGMEFFSRGRNSPSWRGVGSKFELGGLWPRAVRFCAHICVLGGGVQDTERPGQLLQR